MKLLIVDDEELTRNGLAAALDWVSLGITEVLLADDGVNGLSMALTHCPDIILCDVRMPRMDGIAMLEKIKAQLPDICAIFMSGYSDKEYLKAAIQLKAVNYIEKPIQPNEIKAAVLHAVEYCRKLQRQHHAEEAHTNLAATQLAYQLTVPYAACKESIDALCLQFRQHYGTDKFKNVTTFIIKFEHTPEDPADYTAIHQEIRHFLRPMHLHAIYSEKRLLHTVYHIYGTIAPTNSTLSVIAEQFHTLFAPLGHHYIAIGETVCGITKAYHSYESALLLLQNSFFFEPDTVLTQTLTESCRPISTKQLYGATEAYAKALAKPEISVMHTALDALYEACIHVTDFLPNRIKTIYYDLFSSLYKARKNEKLPPDFQLENILDMMESCFSFPALHEMLTEKTNAFFADLTAVRPENSTIYLIREYIGKHYTETGLSVKDISAYAHLSASYACTFFKNETGTTLNQYITEYRMEKAKELLAHPHYKINDISTAVGYSDGNYFGKSFRRYTGLSPSEYREKVLKS